MSFALCLLAQTAQDESADAMRKIWISLAVIVVVAVFVAFLATWIRRKAMMEPGPSIGFTLADLRQMRDDGQIREEEFQTAKTKQLRRTKAALLEDEAADNPAAIPSKSVAASQDASSESFSDGQGGDTQDPVPGTGP